MAALEGSINTPFGSVQKKTALILAGGAVVIVGIVWWRTNQMNAKEPDIYDAEINPATGYPYGSPEDAAALQAQQDYTFPATGGGTGGGGYPPGGTGFTNNAQWTQAVIEYMITNGLVEDGSVLSAALGAYITGRPVTDAQRSLIEQAIAAQGFPPLAGPNGYPPSINTAPTPTPTPTIPKIPTARSGYWFTIPRGAVPISQNGTSAVFKYAMSKTGWGSFTEEKKNKIWYHPNNADVRTKHNNNWTLMKMTESLFIPHPY